VFVVVKEGICSGAFGEPGVDDNALFWNDFDEDAIGQRCAAEQVYGTVAGEAAEHLIDGLCWCD
jgi:hypothetical protein